MTASLYCQNTVIANMIAYNTIITSIHLLITFYPIPLHLTEQCDIISSCSAEYLSHSIFEPPDTKCFFSLSLNRRLGYFSRHLVRALHHLDLFVAHVEVHCPSVLGLCGDETVCGWCCVKPILTFMMTICNIFGYFIITGRTKIAS